MARASSPVEMDTFPFLEWLEMASVKEFEAFGRDPRDPYVLMRQEMRVMTVLMKGAEARRMLEEEGGGAGVQYRRAGTGSGAEARCATIGRHRNPRHEQASTPFVQQRRYLPRGSGRQVQLQRW